MQDATSAKRAAGARSAQAHDATEAATRRLIEVYEHLSADGLSQLQRCYAPDAHFRDPFNDVRGLPAITRVFVHMFETLEQPRFVVTGHLAQAGQAFLYWEFHFRLRRWRTHVAQCIQGATLVRFDEQGRVCWHRDYWDAAQGLYEQFPVLGGLMRWLRRSASAHAQPHASMTANG
ncbi:nuclear transport factor 2 family protein [Melaminivora jejuensis]|uniref:nuclear transport factor 2 family protein n=1 Tax=Melaminivora jejuensis TaxID=1267217 RepID=UPI001ADF0F7A|nr:nuclear transport factor 2 family protein [Melaminivora jejuensis]UHJ65721.1 nuclear transport factor 2 family protein [Melaminivora jejuensis]